MAFHALSLDVQARGQLQTVTAERDTATREVTDLRRRIARNDDKQPTQVALDAFQVRELLHFQITQIPFVGMSYSKFPSLRFCRNKNIDFNSGKK